MEINVNIDAEAINKQITEAVAKSAIGKELKIVIDKEIENLCNKYENPLGSVVKREINTILRQLIVDEYTKDIKEFVRKKMSDEFVKDILGKMWEAYMAS